MSGEVRVSCIVWSGVRLSSDHHVDSTHRVPWPVSSVATTQSNLCMRFSFRLVDGCL